MLTPQQIVELVETLYPHIDKLNMWITKDIIRRVMARLGRGEGVFFAETDKWQLEVFQAAGGHLEALQQELVHWTKQTDAEIARIFEDAAIRSVTYDRNVYDAQSPRKDKLTLSERMVNILQDSYQRTAGTVKNFTRTTAKSTQQRLIQELDAAHFKVLTGAASYTQAVQEAVESIAGTQTRVQYPTGHTDTIETAVLRAVRTGIGQATGNMSIQDMLDHDWDVVLVSAHIGARYGDGGENPGNHFWWQGKFYSLQGKTPGLPPFYESTGYGTGEGLCGWNCRHSFGPGDTRHNPYQDFDAEENKRVYDLSQKQRALERRIRHTKTELLGLREAIDGAEDLLLKEKLTEDYQKTARLLERQNKAYNDFCEENGTKRLADRIQIAKWTREDAKRSVMAASQAERAQAAKRTQEGATQVAPTARQDEQQNGNVRQTAPENIAALQLQPSAESPTDSQNPSANYEDITDNWYPDAKPGSHEVKDLMEYTAPDGSVYKVDGRLVQLDYSKHEKEIAELLEREVGGEIYMVPRVNIPQGVQTPDYLFHGKPYDLKSICENGKHTLYGAVSKKKMQSPNFVLDVTGSSLSETAIEKQMGEIFTSDHTRFVKEIVIVRNNRIVKVYKRKED